MRYISAIGAMAGATLLGSSAFAADLYTPAPVYEPVAAAPAFTWTGFYGGLMGGYGGDKFEYPWRLDTVGACCGDDPRYLDGEFNLTSSGFFAGGQIGGNWQFAPNWVVGVVGDVAWANIKGQLDGDINYRTSGQAPGDIEIASVKAGSEVNWFGTIRGRIGYLPTERFMIYGTGGAAVGETESYGELCFFKDFGGGCGSLSTSETNWGWSAGGGFEVAVTNHITVGAEYLYVDLGDQTLIDGYVGDGDLKSYLNVDTHFHTVKAFVNYLWN